MGGGSRLLDWHLEQRGVRGHAVPLPFTVQAGGHRKQVTPGPGSHGGALWSFIMGPVAPSCLSGCYQRDKHQTGSSVCAHACVRPHFQMYICMCAPSLLCSCYFYQNAPIKSEHQVGGKTKSSPSFNNTDKLLEGKGPKSSCRALQLVLNDMKSGSMGSFISK